jgi:glycosyltransferase involved in cell wall biosynthesis
MDVLAHPSYREGLARTLPQAMLCSVPVVSYDCDGAPEVCLDQKTGRLVRTGDRIQLGQAIQNMLDDPDRAAAMADTGRGLCAQRFDAAEMARRLDELYCDVLRGPGVSP